MMTLLTKKLMINLNIINRTLLINSMWKHLAEWLSSYISVVQHIKTFPNQTNYYKIN